MNTRRLQAFVTLCEHQHMPTVAAELGITQPAVSSAIKVIESGVGTILFERSARGFVPTRFSVELALHCRRILGELRRIPIEASISLGSLDGVVNIGVLAFGNTLILPTAIAWFTSHYPGIKVVTTESPLEELVGRLRSSTLDFIFGAICPSAVEGDLREEALLDDEIALFVGRQNSLLGKRLFLPDLCNVRWILPHRGAPARLLLESAFRRARTPPPVPVVESGDLTTIRSLLIRTGMVAVLSAQQMSHEVTEGPIRRLPVVIPDTTREIGLILRAKGQPSPAAEILMNKIRAEAQESVIERCRYAV